MNDVSDAFRLIKISRHRPFTNVFIVGSDNYVEYVRTIETRYSYGKVISNIGVKYDSVELIEVLLHNLFDIAEKV